ncbi:MAG: GTP cyclohydrolase II, partial [Pseudomonadota bacterium]|nr:GTP cyclohydrolase II [Pseudomonadota bacterium]
MSGHQNFTPTARAPGQVAVDRAIADLRRGGIVALHDQHRDTLAVVAAAELLGATRVSDLTRLAGSAAVLAVTGPRAQALGLAENATTARTIALTRDIDEDMVSRLADPSLAPGDAAALDVSGLTVLPAIGAGPAERALELMKLAGLLPAA